jgi:hypothetical protein
LPAPLLDQYQLTSIKTQTKNSCESSSFFFLWLHWSLSSWEWQVRPVYLEFKRKCYQKPYPRPTLKAFLDKLWTHSQATLGISCFPCVGAALSQLCHGGCHGVRLELLFLGNTKLSFLFLSCTQFCVQC